MSETTVQMAFTNGRTDPIGTWVATFGSYSGRGISEADALKRLVADMEEKGPFCLGGPCDGLPASSVVIGKKYGEYAEAWPGVMVTRKGTYERNDRGDAIWQGWSYNVVPETTEGG